MQTWMCIINLLGGERSADESDVFIVLRFLGYVFVRTKGKLLRFPNVLVAFRIFVSHECSELCILHEKWCFAIARGRYGSADGWELSYGLFLGMARD